MDKFLRCLITFNKRDCIGLACWFALSILCGLLLLPIMVAREIYQYKMYCLPRFEWEDVTRYGIVVLLGSMVHYELLNLILN